MSDRLTPEREAEIAARAEAATPGPWHRSDDAHSLERYVLSEDATLAISFGYRGNRTQAEAEFVAHAREDIPALLAELAAVRAERDQARVAALNEAADHFDRMADFEPDQGYRARIMRGAANDIRRLAATPNPTAEEAS